VLALLAGGAAFALRNPAPSKAAYIVKAEALCVPANQPVAALAKPTSYPELSTAAAAVAAAAGAEATQLGHLRRPSGQNGRDAEAAITALNSYGTQAAALQAAADKKDDAGAIAATKAFQNAFAEASTKAKAFGFTACAAGMQPGVDMTLAGSTAVIKSEFTAKADSLCRGAAKQLDNLPGTPDSIAGLLADLDGSLAITDVTDVSQLELSDGGDWQPCDVVVTFDATSIRLQNPLGFHEGFAWRVLSPMGVTWDGPAAMAVPESGTVL